MYYFQLIVSDAQPLQLSCHLVNFFQFSKVNKYVIFFKWTLKPRIASRKKWRVVRKSWRLTSYYYLLWKKCFTLLVSFKLRSSCGYDGPMQIALRTLRRGGLAAKLNCIYFYLSSLINSTNNNCVLIFSKNWKRQTIQNEVKIR